MKMESTFRFEDRTGLASEPLQLITPMVIPKEAIDAEIERLASLPAPANGRRVSQIVNPAAGVGPQLHPRHGSIAVRAKAWRADQAHPA